ncbi:MAG: phenylalanine--tRNA ligase subunit beta [Desulfatiglandaceae bacterium]
MKVNLNWLKEYVNIELSPKDLCDALTMAGLEVEGLEPVGEGLEKVVSARILSVEPHPDADRLFLCMVDSGKERSQVVCGALNLQAGAMALLALPGARLPNGTVVDESEIRGQLSRGMLLAEDELGLTDDHSGILLLPEETAPGQLISEVLSLPDWVLDISITPNRADCVCVLGVAREIAAITGEKLRLPEIELRESGPEIEGFSSVTIEDPSGCPRYTAGLLQDITLETSPFWMRYRLFHAGVRNINSIVDVTNYVMMEMGQPLHAFDYNRLKENRIVVKRASAGDRFSTLDGQTRILTDETLMICDSDRFVGIAGIMGGLNSEIFAGTANVLVESAYFDPVTIRRSAKYLGLSTEASYRFERGIDIEGVPRALKRSLDLMVQLSGGVVASGILDNYPRPYAHREIKFRPDRCNAYLGTALSGESMSDYLRSLEMDVRKESEELLTVIPPSFRVDINREVDLMEEVARLHGYNEIPVTPALISPPDENELPELAFSDRARSQLASFGFTEIITYSFISPESLVTLNPNADADHLVRILNPLSSDQSVLRTSLIPGLLDTLKTNFSHGEKELKFFEWGKTFQNRGEGRQPVEKPRLVGVMAGPYRRKTWYESERPVDYYDVKGTVEGLLRYIGIESFHFRKGEPDPAYDSHMFSEVMAGNACVGRLGRVSQKIMRAYDLENETAYLFDLDIEALLSARPQTRAFRPFAKFPAVYRDISLLVGLSIESGGIMDIIRQEGKELVESIEIFDYYEGKSIASDQKAIGFRICYRSASRTLDGAEVNRLHETIIDRIRQETGGTLREG